MKKKAHHTDVMAEHGLKYHLAKEHEAHSPHMLYKHEEDRLHQPLPGHGESEMSMGLGDFKGEAANIAMGQAGAAGMKSDEKKIHGQFKHYNWEGSAEH